MQADTIREKALTVPLFVEISADLKNALIDAANEENLPLNHVVARLLAKAFKRPELAVIPRKPRKSTAKVAS